MLKKRNRLLKKLNWKMRRQKKPGAVSSKKIKRMLKHGSPASLIFKCGEFTLDLSERVQVMGVLNVTPDSFSDAGKYFDKEKALEHALRMEADGADIIDIGAESTRPGSSLVSPQQQLERIEEIVEVLGKKLRIPISIDTTYSVVAKRCLDLGAAIINDICALKSDPQMGKIIAQYKAGVILMHMQGTPQTMQDNPQYQDVIDDICKFFVEAKKRALSFGIEPERMAIDPGIGFGKTIEHNLQIIKFLSQFKVLGVPLLIGTSRKSFIGKILDVPVEERDFGTAASVAISVINGANIIRVHDVKKMKQVVKLSEEINKAGS
ncbi:MAG: dihydropteroate synthase [Candidatus Omnitrophota bacterium]